MLQNQQIPKYIAYAVGEIILVVIGILIALQVNNWNEDRKDQRTEKLILQNLLVDINEDLRNLASLNGMLSNRKENADYLLEVIRSPAINIDTVALITALTRAGWILNYTPTFATYNEILNSGKLSLVKSTDLKNKLADYLSQVQDNRRIEEAYDVKLKNLELTAISFCSEIPVAANLYTDKLNKQKLKWPDIDLHRMRKDQEFIHSLKHISYFTATEILYKQNFIISRAEGIKALLETELQ